MTSVAVMREFARNASASNMTTLPDFILKSAHADCKDPQFAWEMMIEAFVQRRELAAHTLSPEDVMGVGATYDEVEAYLERVIDFHAGSLAWGLS